MKAKIYYWHGKWWCRRLGVTGCGNMPKEAWDDMWQLYKEMLQRVHIDSYFQNTNPRQG